MTQAQLTAHSLSPQDQTNSPTISIASTKLFPDLPYQTKHNNHSYSVVVENCQFKLPIAPVIKHSIV